VFSSPCLPLASLTPPAAFFSPLNLCKRFIFFDTAGVPVTFWLVCERHPFRSVFVSRSLLLSLCRSLFISFLSAQVFFFFSAFLQHSGVPVISTAPTRSFSVLAFVLTFFFFSLPYAVVWEAAFLAPERASRLSGRADATRFFFLFFFLGRLSAFFLRCPTSNRKRF